ncbi:hypothetical protein IW15_19835 [Chryseobacterium soli]|uniref:Acyl-CoA dehydrogenase n=1 Tax=Chryseobacterium soli TaxID=445961 RepID=A0A086A1M1_9FLAO|nr:acyl-CoA dehydrogenase family protein [Chryseobacterium soli]KFF10585.1 hypothetical protein IW15_19835 [Chryseobacterium soli]
MESTLTAESVTELSTENYLSGLESIVKEKYNSATFTHSPFPREDWKHLTTKGIMLSMIPEEFGGRNSHQELCDLIEIISTYNLPLGMYTMIITALFIRNITKYGSDDVKNEVLPQFSKEPLIGGFALTEPNCGSNLAKMTTTFEKKGNGYLIKGEKHWQAFSSTADWWLIAAKSTTNEKEFGYFIIQRHEGWKNVEEYNALGLKSIDYGRNEINALVPDYRRLNVTADQLLGAADMLCASRLTMPAMASGFIARIHKEVQEKTKTRKMGNGTLQDVGYVQYKLKQIAANGAITKALFLFLKNKVDLRTDLMDHFFEAQCMKVLATDKMLESALNYQQLCGGEGYRYHSPSNNAAFAVLDSRVYTIFDGTNDLLSQQITEFCMKKSNSGNIVEFLSAFEKTKEGMEHIYFDISSLNNNTTQERKVINGQIISRIFGLHCLEEAKSITQHSTPENIRNGILFLISDIQKSIVETEILITQLT